MDRYFYIMTLIKWVNFTSIIKRYLHMLQSNNVIFQDHKNNLILCSHNPLQQNNLLTIYNDIFFNTPSEYIALLEQQFTHTETSHILSYLLSKTSLTNQFWHPMSTSRFSDITIFNKQNTLITGSPWAAKAQLL